MLQQRRLDLRFSCFILLGVAIFLTFTALWASHNLDSSMRFDPIDSSTVKARPQTDKAVVVASFADQDVDWMKQVPSSWTIHRYIMDVRHPKGGLPVPRNRGREAMAYLTYIIDNYDRFPDHVAFVHGHHLSWHQLEPLQFKIRALNLTALDEVDYINFRCEDMAGCERRPFLDTNYGNWEGEKHMREFWDWMLPDVQLPRYLSFKCCGQFAVTRRAIQRRTLEQWKRIREPLMVDDAEVEDLPWAKAPAGVSYEWLVGTYYEKLWHVIFGTEGENCPSVADCRQRFFSNAIACGGDMDTTTWAVKGEDWKDVRCITAYDHAPPDVEVDLNSFHSMLVTTYGQLQLDRLEQWKRRTKAVTRVEELEAEIKNMTAQVKELGGVVPEHLEKIGNGDKKKDGNQATIPHTEGKHDGRIGEHDTRKYAAKAKKRK